MINTAEAEDSADRAGREIADDDADRHLREAPRPGQASFIGKADRRPQRRRHEPGKHGEDGRGQFVEEFVHAPVSPKAG